MIALAREPPRTAPHQLFSVAGNTGPHALHARSAEIARQRSASSCPIGRSQTESCPRSGSAARLVFPESLLVTRGWRDHRHEVHSDPRFRTQPVGSDVTAPESRLRSSLRHFRPTTAIRTAGPTRGRSSGACVLHLAAASRESKTQCLLILSHSPSALCLSRSARCASACPTVSTPTSAFHALIRRSVMGPGIPFPMAAPLRLLTGTMEGLVPDVKASSPEKTSYGVKLPSRTGIPSPQAAGCSPPPSRI